jgi:hypothetical protein
MKGGVLKLLGMDSIKERKMRDNYGLAASIPFITGIHPASSKIVNAAGIPFTDLGVEWFAKKVNLPNRPRNCTYP